MNNELGLRALLLHGLELVHVARRYNEAADGLAKIASTRGTVPPGALSRDLHEPSVDLGSGAGVDAAPAQPADTVNALLMAAEVMEVEQRPSRPFDWRTPFLDCLIRCELPEDRFEARRIARRAKSYVIYGEDNELYRRSRRGSCSVAPPLKKDGNSSRTYTRVLAATTLLHGPS